MGRINVAYAIFEGPLGPNKSSQDGSSDLEHHRSQWHLSSCAASTSKSRELAS